MCERSTLKLRVQILIGEALDNIINLLISIN
jgi:hypothetical protein